MKKPKQEKQLSSSSLPFLSPAVYCGFDFIFINRPQDL